MEQYVLQTNCLTKQYGKIRAVDEISINIKKGDIYGFIGKNGAGKTTFMKMVCGISSQTSGEIALFGSKKQSAYELGTRVGGLIEAPGLYPNLTARENMMAKALAVGISKKSYIDDILKAVGLSNTGNKKSKKFSVGMKQRLGYWQGICNQRLLHSCINYHRVDMLY